jgi:hypothetical protein
VNFNRQRKAGTKELSGWSQTLEFFGEPDRFGEMVFR